jgi:hypothetical protein
MDYSIQNLSPDSDTINVLVGSNTDSQIIVSIDRDSNGDVFVVVTDNSDGSETRMMLGSSGYTQKL